MAVGLIALAACSSGTKTADLPAGQHDLGGDVSVVVHKVMDPLPPDRSYEERYPGVDADPKPGTRFVAVDLEYFNRSDHPISRAMAYGASLHVSDGRDVTHLVELPTDKMAGVPKDIPAHSTARGWEGYEVTGDAKPDRLLVWGADVMTDPITIDLQRAG